MSTNTFLRNIKVATPCHARWADMAGDARARFCNLCQKHVYDLSALTAAEAEALIREKEGKLCGRFYQRADGTMLTADCPEGVTRVWHGARNIVCAGAAVFVLTLTGIKAGLAGSGPDEVRPRGKIALQFDEALWTVKGWFGMRRPMMTTGDICILPSPTQVPPASTNSSTQTPAQVLPDAK